jgi:ferritin-like metal-binding protein YciE
LEHAAHPTPPVFCHRTANHVSPIAGKEFFSGLLEELLGGHDTSHSAFKDAMMSIVGNLAALGHSTASDEVVKNAFANFAFEHYEIASYSSLLTLAELVGDTAARTALNTSLREEKEMAQWIADHLDDTVRRFVSRSAAGQTAGV